MKTRFCYRHHNASLELFSDELWDALPNHTCRIEVGEGGLRTDATWDCDEGVSLELAVQNGEWVVTHGTNLEGIRYEYNMRLGNILPNEPATRTELSKPSCSNCGKQCRNYADLTYHQCDAKPTEIKGLSEWTKRTAAEMALERIKRETDFKGGVVAYYKEHANQWQAYNSNGNPCGWVWATPEELAMLKNELVKVTYGADACNGNCGPLDCSEHWKITVSDESAVTFIEPKCDCGAEKCRTTHSTWCSAYKGER